MVRNYVKKLQIQYNNKEIQHGLQLINNGALIQVELGLSVAEILKVRKIPILKFQ